MTYEEILSKVKRITSLLHCVSIDAKSYFANIKPDMFSVDEFLLLTEENKLLKAQIIYAVDKAERLERQLRKKGDKVGKVEKYAMSYYDLRRERMANDPEYAEKYKAQQKEARAKRLERIATDPEYAKKVEAAKKASERRHVERMQNDPEYAERIRAERKVYQDRKYQKSKLAKLKEGADSETTKN